jgi:hypothetical protein
MTWWQSEFDKFLMAALVLILCAVSLIGNDKLTAFVLVAAGNAMGCLLTLVTSRTRTPAGPTASVTTSTSTTQAETSTP